MGIKIILGIAALCKAELPRRKKEMSVMKRVLSAILSLVLLLGCVAIFASCGSKPNLDLEEAADALKDAEYYVNYSDDSSEPFIKEQLYAYKGDEKLTVIFFADSKSARLYYEIMKQEHEAELESLELQIEAMEYILKKYDDKMSSTEIDDAEDEIKDLKEELEELEEYVIGRSGKSVWSGTKKAIEHSK